MQCIAHRVFKIFETFFRVRVQQYENLGAIDRVGVRSHFATANSAHDFGDIRKCDQALFCKKGDPLAFIDGDRGSHRQPDDNRPLIEFWCEFRSELRECDDSNR